MRALETALLCLCLSMSQAWAKPPSEAEALVRSATSHYAVGEFTEAIEKYKAAYKLDRKPALLFGIAQSYRKLDKRDQALFFYRSFLREEPTLTEEQRRQITQLITELETVPSASHAPIEPALVSPPAPPPPSPPRRPIYKRWWLWTTVGGVAALGIGLGVGLGLGLKDEVSSDSRFGVRKVSF